MKREKFLVQKALPTRFFEHQNSEFNFNRFRYCSDILDFSNVDTIENLQFDLADLYYLLEVSYID